MSLFISHIDYFSKPPDDKPIDVIEFMTKKLDPKTGDRYCIMDPYIDAVQQIEQPFLQHTVEQSNWTFLMSELIKGDNNFKIITRQATSGLTTTNKYPPYPILYNATQYPNISIEVCKYIDSKWYKMAIHDRYILKQDTTGHIGLHIGSSLCDIVDKDVSVTCYSKTDAKLAWEAFDKLWKECVKQKEWKTT